jgi:glycerol uptake facilitator-like aquaporin
MRAIVSEGFGTGLLVAAVVGSGIMGERLSGGNMALALLANSIATGAVLVTLIFTFGPISGAHFNPAVTLAAAFEGALPWRRAPGFIAAQVIGAICGVAAAHIMFEHPLIAVSHHARVGPAQLFSEFLATFGLLVVIHGTGKRVAVVPLTVAAYITAAYWFTSSTSFANPAVTIARGLTDTFSGIEPAGIPGFIAAQLAGAAAATLLFRWIGNSDPPATARAKSKESAE